jgi:hypothetical protein
MSVSFNQVPLESRKKWGVFFFEPHLVSLLVFAIINFLFCYKYSSRLIPGSLWISVFYFFVMVLAPFLFKGFFEKISLKVLYTVIVLYAAATIISFLLIVPLKIQVDRWSVITSFWDCFFSGKFPYSAVSHHGNAPGPFPVYFLFALPFYLLGEIGFYSLSGFLLLERIIFVQYKETRDRVLGSILLMASTAVLWELLCRSTVLINGVIIALYLQWIVKKEFVRTMDFVWAGAVGGLLLATRGLAVIPMATAYAFVFLKNPQWKNLVVFAVTFLLCFAATLFPFVLWDYDLFMAQGPFALQAGLTKSPFATLFIVTASFSWGFFLKNTVDLFRVIAFMIFLAVSTSFAFNISEFGWEVAFRESRMDISYYLFAFPFLLMSMIRVKNDHR